jgi:DNA-directed RNA polymerase subunit RPC12/RpoP
MSIYKNKAKKRKKSCLMKEERRFKCPYCGCQLLSVIKPTINGNAKGIPKLYYCPDCCKEIFVADDEAEAEKDELENSFDADV